MKKLMILTTALFFSGYMMAQNVIDLHFKNYKQQENFTTISMTGKMFELASYIEMEDATEEFNELKEFIASIDAFNMIIGSEVAELKPKYTSALSKVEKKHEELMSVEDKEGSFKFFIDEAGGVVKELVMVGMTNNELMIFSLEGKMDLRRLGKLTNKIQSGGFKEMGMILENGVDEVKVYPNPASGSSKVNLEIPEQMIGGSATLFDINGVTVKSLRLTERKQVIKTQGLKSGTYVVEFKNDNVSIKKKLIIQD